MTTDGQIERMLAIHREWKRANAEDDEFRIENVRPDADTDLAPAPGEPAITFYMDDDRIIFRDQEALDDYVAGALGVTAEQRRRIMLWHSQYHGGGVDECSSDPSSPCMVLAHAARTATPEQPPEVTA